MTHSNVYYWVKRRPHTLPIEEADSDNSHEAEQFGQQNPTIRCPDYCPGTS
jgi:hypothetical protein